MKKLFVTLMTLFVLLNVRADITTGLVGYWSLSDGPGNSTVADLSGNGNTGTLKNFSDTTFNSMWTPNSDPQNGWPFAMQFNQTNGFNEGTNTYVTIPDSGSLDMPTTNKAWTLSAWIKPSIIGSSEANNACIVCKGNQGAEAYALYLSNGKLAGIQHNAGNTGGNTVTSSTVLASNTWYHVAVTFTTAGGTSKIQMILYINGAVDTDGTANTYTTVYSTNLPVTIGCRNNSSGSAISDPFQGTIDEVRVYDRALAASDISQLYQNKAFALANNGVGYWNGTAGSSGSATLDNTSLNFCTNIYTAPLGTAASLSTLLSVENAASLSLGGLFGDAYYSSGRTVAVTATNINIAAGGVAVGSASGVGTLTFLNTGVAYSLNSTDAIGLKDGANPTALAQSGAGTVILNGTNTFSGGVTINSGTVQVGNGTAGGSPLGTGPVTDNSVLAYNSSKNAVINNAISGTGSVSVQGSGILTLGTANSYSGNTTISSGGTVAAASLGDSGTSSLGTGPVTLNNGNILYTGSGDATVRQFNGTAGTTNTMDVPGGVSLVLNGRVTSASTSIFYVNKVDSGTLTLGGTADNSYLAMNVNAGTVILNKTGSSSVHAIGQPLNVASGATVQFAGSGTSQIYNNAAAPVTINSGGVLDCNGQYETFNLLNLSGTGIGGNGALINSMDGSTSVLMVSINLAANATIGGPGSITPGGVVSGPGTLTYSGGSGILSLQYANTYTGGAIVNSGTLDGYGAGSLPGNVTVTGTGVLQMDNPTAMTGVGVLTLPASPVANSVNLNYGGSQTISLLVIGSTVLPGGTYGAPGSGAATTNIAAFTGPGILTVTGPAYWDASRLNATPGGGGNGNWDNSTANWFNGSTDAAWPLDAQAFFAGTAGTVTLAASVNADALNFSTPGYVITNTDGVSTLTLDGIAPTINIPAGNTAISCTVGVSGSNPLTINGPGTLTLSGANNLNTGVTINDAVLNVPTISDGGASAIGQAGTMTIQGGGTLTYSGNAPATTTRLVTAIGAATSYLNVPAGSLELSGQLKAGAGTTGQVFTKTGAGTLILDGSGDNTAATMAINQGTVIIAKTSASNVHGLGSGTSTVGSGAELQLGGPADGNYDLFTGSMLVVNDGAVFDVNGATTGMSTLTMSGSGSGSGALINSAPATTSILTNNGGGVVLSAPTTVGGAGSITLASSVTGSGSLTYAGTGTLTLNVNGSYTGGTTINSNGTVQMNAQTAAGNGTIADNGTLAVNIASGTLLNTVTGNSYSIIKIIETSGDNLTLNGSLSGFNGTINCPTSPGGNAKAQIGTGCNLPSTATVNVAAGGTVFLTGSTCAANVVLNGLGNAEVYGALRMDGGTQKGPVTLNANSTIGNGVATVSTISGVIGDGGNGYGITKTATADAIILTATNTYTGSTTISQGILAIGGAGCLGATANYATNLVNNGTFDYASSAAQTLSGVVSGTGLLVASGPGVLTLNGQNVYTGDTVVSNNGTLLIGGGGGLGVGSGVTNYAGAITNNGTLNYVSSAAQTLSGVISGNGALIDSGSGSLTLSGANSYTGNMTITNGGTLVLASSGSINSAASLNLSAGATFDVSAYGLAYAFGAGTTVKAGGTGTGVGTAAATIEASGGATVTVGSLLLNYTPASFSGDATHPALYVSAGALNVSGNSVTVNNKAATPLGAGSYSLAQVSGGSVSASSTNVTVTGAGLAAGATASLAVSGGSLNLVVVSSAVSVPVVNSVSVSGNNLVFSGINGPHGGNYYVVASTNLALPLSQWTPIATNSFDGSGAFSASIPVSGLTPAQYFSIKIP